ncbi:MAG: hypothetical protein AAGC85_13565 [Bacteroidota bacterium]
MTRLLLSFYLFVLSTAVYSQEKKSPLTGFIGFVKVGHYDGTIPNLYTKINTTDIPEIDEIRLTIYSSGNQGLLFEVGGSAIIFEKGILSLSGYGISSFSPPSTQTSSRETNIYEGFSDSDYYGLSLKGSWAVFDFKGISVSPLIGLSLDRMNMIFANSWTEALVFDNLILNPAESVSLRGTSALLHLGVRIDKFLEAKSKTGNSFFLLGIEGGWSNSIGSIKWRNGINPGFDFNQVERLYVQLTLGFGIKKIEFL